MSLSINSAFQAPRYIRTLFGLHREHSFLCHSAKKSEQELKDEEMELFTKYYMEWKGGKKSDNISYANIPRFYYRVSEVSRLTSKKRLFYVIKEVSLTHRDPAASEAKID